MKSVRRALAIGLLFCAFASADDQITSLSLPKDGESVILFLLDNSASLPPLDPEVQRRDAIEKIYSFLKGQPYRLVLFGGRNEIYIDAPQHYRNSGQWTDFYFAFRAAVELTKEYPAGTDFKVVLITDGKIDPSPKLPLYVILIGEEVDHELIQRMVVAANGKLASNDYAQGIADFFDDDGMLLRRFIFRLEKDEGLETIAPIVTRIATPSTPRVEFSLVGSLLIAVAVLIGIGVRSFPGSGDRELVEMRVGEPLHIAVDRLRRLSSDVPAWSRKGLSLVESSKGAAAKFTLHEDSSALPPTGFSLDSLDPTGRDLIGLSLPALRQRLDHLSKEGNKDEQIYALNLEYVAKDMEEARVERIVGAAPAERKKLAANDFLRAKVHLLHNEKLRKKLTSACVLCKVYGLHAQEQELRQGSRLQLGRYQFRCDELAKGGRKDFRIGLTYEQVPSPLFLKRLVPGSLQRTLRLRRSHERVVR
jgi:hypothetical protein